MNDLFANTGVQLLFFLIQRSNLDINETGQGWQRCRVQRGDRVEELRFIQWQWVDSPSRLFLAVDTTCGDPRRGYFAAAETLVEHQMLDLGGLLDASGRGPLNIGQRIDHEGRVVPGPLSFAIRARGDGDPRDVHLAIDFGNSRTGALLLEVSGRNDRTEDMLPLELTNRYKLDAWDERGRLVKRPYSRWFTSQTHWCTSPYLTPEPIVLTDMRKVKKSTVFGTKEVFEPIETEILPSQFDDLSLVRMGREALDVTNAIRGELRPLTGLSSPKRYLWADDGRWLQGADWYMADPFDRHDRQDRHVTRLQGPLLRYFDQSDPDDVLDAGWDQSHEHLPNPLMPRFAPRSLMTAALYELMCQAYALVNSAGYRKSMGEMGRLRRLTSVSLSYPSGMIAPERDRFLLQARKAARIFDLSLGRMQDLDRGVSATLSVDEASAVHLTFIWSELQLIDNRPDFWFEVTGRRRVPVGGAANPTEAPGEVRIACIDIGGGTTDLMIARYTYQSQKAIDTIHGEVLHRDGVSLAGDQLIKRLLERIIVPEFGRAVGLDHTKLQLLFGPETKNNLGFRPQRIDWINRFFVPLAVAYLERAATGSSEPVLHTDPDIVKLEVLEGLQAKINELYGIGEIDLLRNELRLVYNHSEFEKLVRNVFQDLLFDFCGRIVKYDADIVLLAGQPTKLQPIQELIRSYLPLTSSRIIPMHNYYAGHRYPYQDENNKDPGRIVDPKSAVVVGTAIHHLARRGMLSKLKFVLDDPIRTMSYYWGILNDRNFKINAHNVLLRDKEGRPTAEEEFPVSSDRLLIGRRLSPSDSAQPSPVYMLKLVGDGDGEIQVKVKLSRYIDPVSKEELLRLVDAKGTVRGVAAEAGKNVRLDLVTLAHERYYLDSGGLDNIAST